MTMKMNTVVSSNCPHCTSTVADIPIQQLLEKINTGKIVLSRGNDESLSTLVAEGTPMLRVYDLFSPPEADYSYVWVPSFHVILKLSYVFDDDNESFESVYSLACLNEFAKDFYSATEVMLDLIERLHDALL